jgi:hypothetical protein
MRASLTEIGRSHRIRQDIADLYPGFATQSRKTTHRKTEQPEDKEEDLFLSTDAENSPGIASISLLEGDVTGQVGINREYDHEFSWWQDWKVQEVEGVCLVGVKEAGKYAKGLKVLNICSGVWNAKLGQDSVFLKWLDL